MIRLTGIFIIASLSFLSLSAQLDPVVAAGDSIFRYATSLKNDITSFRSINLQYLEFPCVDHFTVKASSRHNTDFELVTKDYKEFYRRESNMLEYSGYQGPDAFQTRSTQMIVLNNALPLARTYRKDDFYETRTNEFFAVYNPDDMESSLRTWTESIGASQIRINGKLTSEHTYKQSDSFDNHDEIIEGFATESELVYSVNAIEVNKGKWETVELNEHDVLKENFADINYRFLSFFAYDSLVEIARIELSPQPGFFFNSKRRLGRHMACSHSGLSIYIYPNPTFGDLNAKFNNADPGTYNFTVSNIIGKRIWEGQLNIDIPNQELPIKLPYLSKGVYLYRLSDPSGKLIQSQRLIIVEP